MNLINCKTIMHQSSLTSQFSNKKLPWSYISPLVPHVDTPAKSENWTQMSRLCNPDTNQLEFRDHAKKNIQNNYPRQMEKSCHTSLHCTGTSLQVLTKNQPNSTWEHKQNMNLNNLLPQHLHWLHWLPPVGGGQCCTLTNILRFSHKTSGLGHDAGGQFNKI